VEVARVQPTDSPKRELLSKELPGSLCEVALREGAHECSIIDCRDLIYEETSRDEHAAAVEERSLFWPLPRFPKDSIRDALEKYEIAVVFRLNLEEETQIAASPDRRDYEAGSYSPDSAHEQVFKIAGLLESACFYGGCHLSIGLAAGNCKDVFCRTERRCQALKTGKPCLHPLKSRPSIEACGLDPLVIASKAGWGDPEKEAFLVGMVFVG
jgi:hypothetical protein